MLQHNTLLWYKIVKIEEAKLEVSNPFLIYLQYVCIIYNTYYIFYIHKCMCYWPALQSYDIRVKSSFLG